MTVGILLLFGLGGIDMAAALHQSSLHSW